MDGVANAGSAALPALPEGGSMRWEDPTTPRYVLATAADAHQVVRRMSGAGWQVREGFEPLAGVVGRRLVRFGVVADPSTAVLVVRAAASGAGVVAVVDGAASWVQSLVDDLARFGPVRRCCDPPDGPAGTAALPPLQPDERALLERLAAGQTIAAAAAAEFMSLRTANRRIAAIRRLFDVTNTRDAVRAYLRLRGST
jgi:DNA-binding CsgD family transcriptional regulator